MRPKEVPCEGFIFPSLLELASHYGVHPSTVARRIREGWTTEQAVGLSPKPGRIRSGVAVTFQGKKYSSLAGLAREFGIAENNLRARLQRGLAIDQAIAGVVRKPKGNAAPVEFDGITFESKSALANAFGVTWAQAGKRLCRGWTMRQALGIEPPPPRFRNHDGHARDIKWKQARRTNNAFEPVPDTGGYKIYVITNSANGKQYVGLTAYGLPDRLKQHFASARRGRKAPLPNAIRKYGEKCFSIELVRSDAKSLDELQDQEIREICARRTMVDGYNAAAGGSLGTSKPIEVAGRLFPSRVMAAAHYGVDVSVFNLRLTRLKWTAEEAAGLVTRSWKGKEVAVEVRGVLYPSLRQAAIALGKNFRKVYDRYSEKGWSLEQALDLAPPPESVKFSGSEVCVYGIRYASIAKAAEAHGIHAESLRRRLSAGQTAEVAVEAALQRKRKRC
jgi:hypothetical protein